MITTTTQGLRELAKLPVDKNLLVVDENDREYIIETIVQRQIHDDDNSWCYALKIVLADEGCIKRSK